MLSYNFEPSYVTIRRTQQTEDCIFRIESENNWNNGEQC